MTVNDRSWTSQNVVWETTRAENQYKQYNTERKTRLEYENLKYKNKEQIMQKI